MEKVLCEGGRGKGDGKKTNQRLLGDEEKEKPLWQ